MFPDAIARSYDYLTDPAHYNKSVDCLTYAASIIEFMTDRDDKWVEFCRSKHFWTKLKQNFQELNTLKYSLDNGEDMPEITED